MRRQVVGITAVRVGEQDDAIEVLVLVESAKDRTAVFGPRADLTSEVEIPLGHGSQGLRVEAFDRRDQVKGQLLVDGQTVPPAIRRLEVLVGQIDLGHQGVNHLAW